MHIHSRCTHFQTPNHSSNQVCLDMVLECHKKSSRRSYHSSQSEEVAPRGQMACSRWRRRRSRRGKWRKRWRSSSWRLVACYWSGILGTDVIYNLSTSSPAVTACVTVLSVKSTDLITHEICTQSISSIPNICGEWTIWHFYDIELNHCCDFIAKVDNL